MLTHFLKIKNRTIMFIIVTILGVVTHIKTWEKKEHEKKKRRGKGGNRKGRKTRLKKRRGRKREEEKKKRYERLKNWKEKMRFLYLLLS